MKRDSEQGFTLLEVTIAITIFAFLMIYVSQMMTTQIRVFDTVSRQTELEQKARVAMMHILDEIRLHKSTYFYEGPSGVNSGVYYKKSNSEGDIGYCLININPNFSNPSSLTGIHFDRSEHSLWYRDTDDSTYLITDQIDSIELNPVTQHLLRINITVKDQPTNEQYQLLSWARLY